MTTTQKTATDYPAPKKPKPVRTVGGQFNSIGSAATQADNTALVRRLMDEVATKSTVTLSASDLLFIEDVRHKFAQPGNQMFGWRQVEAVVRIHKQLVDEEAGR